MNTIQTYNVVSFTKYLIVVSWRSTALTAEHVFRAGPDMDGAITGLVSLWRHGGWIATIRCCLTLPISKHPTNTGYF